MAGNTKISKGILVRWFEYYSEGIVKDAGLGTIVSIKKNDLDWADTPVRYEVWRHKKNDFFWCGAEEVELLIIKQDKELT